MSDKPDFLQRRRNFDAREKFYAVFDRYNKHKNQKMHNFQITSKPHCAWSCY